MRRCTVARAVPGATAGAAVALWSDLARWPGFVDGFAAVARVEGVWPQAGARIVWDSRPGGRGRVVERVVEHRPAALVRTELEDAALRGEQVVRAAAARAGGCRIELELRYELKRGGLGGRLADLLVVRHRVRAALERTAERFAVELAAEPERAS